MLQTVFFLHTFVLQHHIQHRNTCGCVAQNIHFMQFGGKLKLIVQLGFSSFFASSFAVKQIFRFFALHHHRWLGYGCFLLDC